MLSDLLTRATRRELLLEFNPHQILAAAVTRLDRGGVEINGAAEFDARDEAGLRRWLDANGLRAKSVRTTCGYIPAAGLLQRETVQPRRLAEPGYVSTVLREDCQVSNPDDWITHVVSPADGAPLPPENTSRPALVCGIPKSDVRRLQNRLAGDRIFPGRIEPGLLPLFGSIFRALARQGDKRSAVVVLVEDDQTTAYILGREGVYTPNPIRHGLRSLMNFAGKELGLTDDGEIRDRLARADDHTRSRAPKFVRALCRELRPVVDSAEMSTGQPVGGIYFACLPPALAWLSEPIAAGVERTAMSIDCNNWLENAGVRSAIGVAPFGPHWLGALSLLADFSDPAASASGDRAAGGPWHVDCRLADEVPESLVVRRRFMGGAVAAALAACGAIVAVWQLYVANDLRRDLRYWETEMAKNQSLFAELTAASKDLQAGVTRLNHAYELMATPFQVTEFVMNLGRTLPPNMRVDRIESTQGRIAVTGGLREPSDAAGGKLNGYLETLRRSPNIGPLFSSIGLTALQRDEDPDWLAFEITFRPKPPAP